MSQIGYYRYMIDNLPIGTDTIAFYVNGNLAVTHTINIKSFCTSERLIKYLDKNGQYRFYSFTKNYETKDKPRLLGKSNKLITSILTDQTNQKNIGYKNERIISLVADAVTEDEMIYLQDLWTSPRVYLHVGTENNNELKDWLEVTIIGGDTISKRRKIHTGKIAIEIQLPEWFTVTML